MTGSTSPLSPTGGAAVAAAASAAAAAARAAAPEARASAAASAVASAAAAVTDRAAAPRQHPQGPILPALLDDQAAAFLKLAQALTFTTELTALHRITFKVTETAGVTKVQIVSDTGVAIATLYRTAQGDFVVLGKRFDKDWKASIGGKVEEEDKTLQDGSDRERTEEYFDIFPSRSSAMKNQGDLVIKGGVSETVGDDTENGTHRAKGWGPHLGAVCEETGYTTQAELQEKVDLLNENAKRHYPVATYFGTRFDADSFEEKTAEFRQQGAQTILDSFKELGPGMTDLSVEARAYLEALAKDGDAPLPEGFKNAREFAEKHVHDHTEYSEFKLVPYAEFKEMCQDPKTHELFGQEDKMREKFIEIFG